MSTFKVHFLEKLVAKKKKKKVKGERFVLDFEREKVARASRRF